MIDNDDGSYTVKYRVEEACDVCIEIKHKNEKGELVEIRSSPKTASFTEQASVKNNSFVGPNVMHHI